MTYDELRTQMETEIADLTDSLENGETDPDTWYDDMAQALTKFYLAACMLGLGSSTIPAAVLAQLSQMIQAQLTYLDGFYLAVISSPEWQGAFNSRALSYAKASNQMYWKGKTANIPLPAMPGEGTECDGNCGCDWQMDFSRGLSSIARRM